MQSNVSLMWVTPDPEFQIIRSARICYNSGEKIDSHWVQTDAMQDMLVNKKMTVGVPMMKVKIGPNDEGLLRTLMKNQHNTCLRFASASFHIDNISRVCSHQMVRIAHFGILQRSQRYCNEGDTSFVFPAENEKFKDFASKAKALYNEAIADGMTEEDARYILPNASTTQLNLVSNFQGWKHLLAIRLNKHVQFETRLVAIELCKQLYELAPIVFESDYKKIEELKLEDK
jgi:thymidylate synthase (FAD)